MTPEITLKMAIIWKMIATLFFILIAKGLLSRVFKFKLVYWFVFIIGTIALFAAIRMDLVGMIIGALKKKETRYVTVEKQVPQPVIVPQPVVTPTTVPIEIEIEQERPVVYQKPEEGENVFYVEAPVGRYGETIFTPTGYEYDYWPEDNVYGLSEPNGTSVSFEYGPNFPLTNIGKSVAWASRTGYPVRIKVVKKWIGSGYGV